MPECLRASSNRYGLAFKLVTNQKPLILLAGSPAVYHAWVDGIQRLVASRKTSNGGVGISSESPSPTVGPNEMASPLAAASVRRLTVRQPTDLPSWARTTSVNGRTRGGVGEVHTSTKLAWSPASSSTPHAGTAVSAAVGGIGKSPLAFDRDATTNEVSTAGPDLVHTPRERIRTAASILGLPPLLNVPGP